MSLPDASQPSVSSRQLILGRMGASDGTNWDARHNRLLVAHGRNVLVIDPTCSQQVRAIGTIAGANAALAIPDIDHLLVTSGKDCST